MSNATTAPVTTPGTDTPRIRPGRRRRTALVVAAAAATAVSGAGPAAAEILDVQAPARVVIPHR